MPGRDVSCSGFFCFHKSHKMDKNRNKNGNAERSIEYIVFYVKPNGQGAKTRCSAKSLEKVCAGLEKTKNSVIKVIPATNIKG